MRCRPAAWSLPSTRTRRVRSQLVDLVQGVLKSVSQVFLKGNGVSALLFLAGLAVNSLAAAVFALVGALLAVLTAHLFGAESDLITGGLLGFSPVLTAVALGAVFYQPSVRVVAYALVGTVFTVIVQAALNVALTPFAIPALTAPFVLASWLFLLPRQCFEPAAAANRDTWRDVALMSGEVFLDFNPWGVDARAEGDRGWSRFGQPSAIDMLRQLIDRTRLLGEADRS